MLATEGSLSSHKWKSSECTQEDEAELLSQALELSLAEEKERQQRQSARPALRSGAGGTASAMRSSDYIPPSVATLSEECVARDHDCYHQQHTLQVEPLACLQVTYKFYQFLLHLYCKTGHAD